MDKLVKGIRDIFHEDCINTEEVRRLLEAYKSDARDWRKYAHFDAHKYTRNLVDIGNGKYNLLILCWGPGMGSSIHDHTDAHCFVKVLEGSLLETRFAWPEPNPEGGEQVTEKPMVETGNELYGLNGVTYISDQIGLHRMENPSHADVAVTLHLYIPPFQHCQVFDQRTSRQQRCPVTFYTKFGHKVDYMGSKEGRLMLPAGGGTGTGTTPKTALGTTNGGGSKMATELHGTPMETAATAAAVAVANGSGGVPPALLAK